MPNLAVVESPKKESPISTPAAPAAEAIQQLPLSALHPSVNNPRRTFEPQAMRDLEASISKHGVRTPLLVRPYDFGSDEASYEIVAGGRRYRAAEGLRLNTLPCIVREMSDEEAAEIAIIDNLQRADVHPLEEAEAFEQLRDTLGSVAAVAAKLGKEQSYVAKILKLTELTVHSRDALRGGLITIEHALLLARLAEAEQNAALKWCLDRNAGVKVSIEAVVAERLKRLEQQAEQARRSMEDKLAPRFFGYQWEPMSVVQLKAWIEAESGILLARAPWSLTEEDYLLPDVGTCAECEKNTTANAPLFGDLQMGEPTCTDGACFAAKTQEFVQIELRKAGHNEQAKPKVLVPRLSWKYSSVKPSIVPNDLKIETGTAYSCYTANPAKLLKAGQWVEAKPGSCRWVRPGVTADWSDDGDRGYMGRNGKLRKPGETLHVCIAAGCKVHPKDWEKPKAATAQQQASESPEAKAKREAEAAAYKAAELPVRIAFMRLLVVKATAKPEVILRELLFGALEQVWDADFDAVATAMVIAVKGNDAEGAIERWIESARADELLRLAVALCNAEALYVNGPSHRDRERKDVDGVAKKYGMTWKFPDAPEPAKKTPAKPAVKKAAKKAVAKKKAPAKAVAKKAVKKAGA